MNTGNVRDISGYVGFAPTKLSEGISDLAVMELGEMGSDGRASDLACDSSSLRNWVDCTVNERAGCMAGALVHRMADMMWLCANRIGERMNNSS